MKKLINRVLLRFIIQDEIDYVIFNCYEENHHEIVVGLLAY